MKLTDDQKRKIADYFTDAMDIESLRDYFFERQVEFLDSIPEDKVDNFINENDLYNIIGE
jgi:hypothetical protein